MRNRMFPKQQGVALVIVLMMVALVVIVGAEMAGRLQLQVMRATNIKDNNQAYWYAMGAEQFAKKSIVTLLKKDPNVVSLEGGWSEEFAFPLEGGGIQAQLLDMQACFNLNGVSATVPAAKGTPATGGTSPAGSSSTPGNKTAATPPPSPSPGGVPETAQAFERLLDAVIPSLDNYSKEVVRDSLLDWLDDNDELSTSGAEDSDYAALVNPYLTANRLMANKSELRLVNGVQPQWLGELLPQICVIPGFDQLTINVNTITEEQAPVLAALAQISTSDAQSLISNRKPSGYDDIQNFLSESVFGSNPLSAQQQQWFATKTEYFLLHTKTRYNNASFAMSTVFVVSGGNEVSVVSREFGGIR